MGFDDIKPQISRHDVRPEHYYGDYVRRLLLAGGVLMVLSYPLYYELVDLPVWTIMFFMLLISFFAGLQTPRYRWSALVNTAVSTLAFSLFSYKASTFYLEGRYGESPLFFWINQLLALTFFFGIYFSVKSMRAKTQ